MQTIKKILEKLQQLPQKKEKIKDKDGINWKQIRKKKLMTEKTYQKQNREKQQKNQSNNSRNTIGM